jgi:hypothetical protein
MATNRTNKVEVQITANDEASKTIDRLERKIDGLESDEARIIVKADTERLERQLDNARTKLEGLDGDEASVQARLIGSLEADLEHAQQLYNQLDGKTGTVRLEANAADALGDIDRVESELRQLDGTSATVRVDSAGGRLGSLGRGAAAGAAGLGAALTAGGVAATEMALSVEQIAAQSGASVETVGRLVSIWQQAGLDVGDLIELLFQVNVALIGTPELATTLGVRNATDLVDQLLQAIDGLDEIEDPFVRGQTAAQTFGEAGVVQVGRIDNRVGDLQTAMDALSETQFVTQDDIDKAKELNDEWVKAKGHWQEIELAILRSFVAITNGVESYFQGVYDAGGEFREWWDTAGPGALWGHLMGGEGPVAPGQMPQAPQAPQSTYAAVGQRGQGAYAQNVTIVNPPGTPAATANQTVDYQLRNGIR